MGEEGLDVVRPIALAASRGSSVARDDVGGAANGPDGIREGSGVARGVLRRSIVVFSRVATWIGVGREDREPREGPDVE